ncbi:acyl-CoA dehydratase activase-related protein [Orenia marismortui]|uniref:acyl-CoA dehydratase activase-related protein n=1 Tax=Orenia marismortui TaxID=46469 RepID=UPI000372ABB4|nr:acyl-CoA dehydratase activase-related protein [Orenia marismortui]
MKVTFPHMGTMSIPVKTLLTELGLDVIVPPAITKKTLDLGVKYSPEFACLPLKLNIGNYIESLEKGADTIIMGGGVGPCRFGYYGEVQKDILNDLGYNFNMIIFEPIQGHWKEFYKSLKMLLGNISIMKIKTAWERAWVKAKAVDHINRLTNQLRPYLVNRKEATKLYNQGLTMIDNANNIDETRKVTDKIENRLNSLEQVQGYTPLKVGLVGEIYVLLEPFTNLHIEEKLGELGVLVDKSVYLTDWIEEHLYISIFRKDKNRRRIAKLAKPYLNYFVGGHGVESVGEAVLYSQKNFDGVVHLGPFTCMPEIIAQSILPTVSKDLDIPILSLSVDEHTGEAGYITRLEAFVDLLSRKDKKKEKII